MSIGMSFVGLGSSNTSVGARDSSLFGFASFRSGGFSSSWLTVRASVESGAFDSAARETAHLPFKDSRSFAVSS